MKEEEKGEKEKKKLRKTKTLRKWRKKTTKS